MDGDGAAGNYKPIQAVVGDPTASGNSTTFIDTIAQDANGKITATKKSVNFSGYATTAQLGNYIPTSEKVNAAAVAHTNFPTNGTYVPTMNFLSYWNGAYNSGNASNLTYCTHGAFGTIVTKSDSYYLPKSGGTMTGDIAMGSTSENTITTNKIDSAFQELTHKNKYGYIALGPFNADHAHIYTDRNNFYFNKSLLVNGTNVSLEGHTHSQYSTTDTKNTAGATNTSSKIYLIGATSQGANPQTYSHDTAYVGTDGCMYSTNFITTSDRRMKDNITEIVDASKSLELGFYEFDYKSGGHSAGHIAQEVREVLPEFVHGEETETTHLSVDYTGLHSVQIKALKDEVDTLKIENKELRERLEKLEALLEKLV